MSDNYLDRELALNF